MSETWWIAEKGERHGPFTFDSLIGEIENKASEVFVWREGFINWELPSNVPEVCEELAARASLLPPQSHSRAGMKKFGGWLIWTIAFGLAFWGAKEGVRYLQRADTTLSTTPGLTGGYRDGFVGAATRTCFDRQSTAPENASLAKPQVTAYCVCFANGMADMISDATLKSMDGLSNADRITRMQPVIDAVAPSCIKDLETSLPK